MFRILLASGLLFIFASGAFAANSKYQLAFSGEPVQGLTISSVVISASDEVANETKLFDNRDVEQMKAVLHKKVMRQLTKAGTINPNGVQLKLTLTDLKPNRPTMAQFRDKPGLSFQSIAIGGASIEGQIIAADGTEIGTVSFTWQESWIDQVQGATVWYDARRAFDRFARRFARDISANSGS